MAASDSTELQIADAVVALLAAPPAGFTFTLSFTPVVAFMPIYDLTQLSTLQVVAMPGGEEDVPFDRQHSQLDVDIDVGIQQKLPGGAAAALTLSRSLMGLAAQIKKLLKLPAGVGPLTLADGRQSPYVAMRARPLWHEPHYLEERAFTRILTFTYRAKDPR